MHRTRPLFHTLTIVVGITLCSERTPAQSRLAAMATAGYAAGIDSPVMADGSLSLRAAVWVERRSGVDLGVVIGLDRFEDRTLVTGSLFFDPGNGSIGTTRCANCLAGSAAQRIRMQDWYVTPSITVRRRTGPVQPYASLAAGAYRVQEARGNQFRPVNLAGPVGESTVTTRKWTAGGSISLGVRLPVHRRFAIDVSSQLHGAALIGNDYAGGAGYGVVGLGVVLR